MSYKGLIGLQQKWLYEKATDYCDTKDATASTMAKAFEAGLRSCVIELDPFKEELLALVTNWSDISKLQSHKDATYAARCAVGACADQLRRILYGE